jgi:ATP-dependent RNA helicase RhlE
LLRGGWRVTLPALTFEELRLIEPLRRAIQDEGYTTPTPIQEGAIPLLLQGRDLLGCAQTGTGKTAAFALPILQHLANVDKPRTPNRPRVLVLAPTRELAAQIGDSFKAYGAHLRLRVAVIFGGVGQGPQVQALRTGVDTLVATPGRLLDLMEQKLVALDRVEVFVLDEADRMLDMGFIRDIRRIVPKLPSDRQTLLFSATMPKEIAQLAGEMLRDPARVSVAPAATPVEKIEQEVMFVDKADKPRLLVDVLREEEPERVLVFTRTKHGANRVVQQLERDKITAEAIHGNKSQSARLRALGNFKSGHTQVLVATDIAARGLDIDGVSHVINFDLPNEPEVYVHRIGRTARAGAEGIAISFCGVEERGHLHDIESLIRRTLPVVDDHPYHSTAAERAPLTNRVVQGGGGGGGGARKPSGRGGGRRRHDHERPHRRGR